MRPAAPLLSFFCRTGPADSCRKAICPGRTRCGDCRDRVLKRKGARSASPRHRVWLSARRSAHLRGRRRHPRQAVHPGRLRAVGGADRARQILGRPRSRRREDPVADPRSGCRVRHVVRQRRQRRGLRRVAGRRRHVHVRARRQDRGHLVELRQRRLGDRRRGDRRRQRLLGSGYCRTECLVQGTPLTNNDKVYPFGLR